MEHLYGWPRSPGVRLVYVAKAAYDGMTKGRISSPNHAYALLTARISNQSSGVRVSVAVVLRVIFRAVCCVFPVLCGSLPREWVFLPVGRRKRAPAVQRVLSARIVCGGSLCSAIDPVLDLGGKLFQSRHDVLVALGHDPTMQSLKKGVAPRCGK